MEGKRKLSILLVSSYVFTKDPGGVKEFILGLKTALLKAGCIVNVIAPGSKDAQEKGLVDFVLGMGFRMVTDQTEFRASLSRKTTAKKILDAVKPDIIVIHEPFVPSIGHTIISSVARREDGRPEPIIIGQFHARREDFNWSLKVAEFIVRHFARRPKLDKKTLVGFSSGYVSTIDSNLDGRIAVSQSTKRFWEEKMPANYKVIYNGINTDKFTVDGPRIGSWLKEKRKIILFVGRHDRRKGIDDLIKAVRILVSKGVSDISLKITGHGEMTESLSKLVCTLGLKKYVQFVGILSNSELVKAYRTADVVVAPSTAGEGFNRTIIEGRSCGKLVVCTNIKGQREAIGKDLASFMAKPKNPEDLSRQIMTVLPLKTARKQHVAKHSREEVKKLFSWDVIAKKHIAFYKKLLSKYGDQGKNGEFLYF